MNRKEKVKNEKRVNSVTLGAVTHTHTHTHTSII